MKTTEQLIQELSLQATNVETINFKKLGKSFLLRISAYSLLILILISQWGVSNNKIISSTFLIENSLMLLISLTTLCLTYFSAIPSKLDKKHFYSLITLTVALILSLVYRLNMPTISEELHSEMFLARGICSSVILFFTFIESYFLTKWVKEQAPTKLILSSMLIITTSATMGSFLTNFFCTEHNSLHVMMWHITPIILAAILGSFFTSKKLKW